MLTVCAFEEWVAYVSHLFCTQVNSLMRNIVTISFQLPSSFTDIWVKILTKKASFGPKEMTGDMESVKL